MLLAQIVADAYNRLFPYNAVDVSLLWGQAGKTFGVGEIDLFFVERGEVMQNIPYLRRLAQGLGAEEDPAGGLARAAQQALNRLSQKRSGVQ